MKTASAMLMAGLLLLCGVDRLRAADDAFVGPPAPVKPQREFAGVSKLIDAEIQKKLDENKLKPSPVTDDAEFLRRVYLDITGKIPPADKAVAFLDSTDPAKRAKVIDDLLASPDYGRHFAIIWRTNLVKRDIDNNRNLNAGPFQDWLAGQFNENKNWDKIVQEILTAEGEVDKNPAAIFYLANRDMTRVDPAKITGAVSNMFMGVMMQCAECHNHPFVRQWKQTDFWGMAAFFGRVRDSAPPAQNGKQTAVSNIGETASANTGKQRPFGGGFGKGGANPTGAVIAIPSPTQPGRTIGTAKAKFFEAEEPRLSSIPYRPTFAAWVTSPTNKYFSRSMSNRMWAHFFARGIVNPIEDMHDDNEPSHPELLTALAKEFVASEFDLKHLIRAITNSQTYQRTSAPIAENKDDDKLFSHQLVKVMDAEMLYDSLTMALGNEPSTGGGFTRGGGGGAGRGGPPTGRAGFVRFFDTKEDADDPTDSGHGIPQYLRLMNSAAFNRGAKITDQLARQKASPDQALETLYLTTLARRPTPAEAEKLKAYMAKQPDLKRGFDGALWVLLNSAEFLCVR